MPEGGIIYLLSRLVGQLKARNILYRSRPLSGEEAVDFGLATRLVSDSVLDAEAITIAREAAAGAPLAFALTKRLFNIDAAGFDAFLDQELNAIAIAANLGDAAEGMAAFRERRPPRFTGR